MATVLNDRAVTDALASIFASEPQPARLVKVLERRPNGRASTLHSEILTCLLSDGRELTLLCKYGHFLRSSAPDHSSWGHRRGGGYEADVYRRVLEPIRAGTPRFFGAGRDEDDGASWLLLEYLDDARRPRAAELPAAALWIARFHQKTQPIAANGQSGFLIRYDEEYYAGWARRTAECCKPFRDVYPWVEEVCSRFVEFGVGELAVRPTIVHGEYFRRNLLIRGEQLYVVDWESCAVGAPEIDLAMLCDGWPDDVQQQAVDCYVRARWPEGGPADFGRRLCLASVYSHLRWLGNEPDWTLKEPPQRFYDLRRAADGAGLLQ